MKPFIKDLFTEPDNHTFCPVRLMGFVGTAQFLVLSVINYAQHAVFDPQAYAIGFGALLGGLGVALGMKKNTPPAV